MRAFIAFELPEVLRSALAALSAGLQAGLCGVPLNWVPPRNMHLTLRFLGEIRHSQAAALGEALQAIADHSVQLAVRLSTLGAFPGVQHPRVLWAGLHASAALTTVAAQVEQAAMAAGLPAAERPFMPHLTLARVRRQATPAQLAGVAAALAAQPLPTLNATLGELVLFESQLKAGGAVYNPRVRASLRSTKG